MIMIMIIITDVTNIKTICQDDYQKKIKNLLKTKTFAIILL